jgi:hypothetical protein
MHCSHRRNCRSSVHCTGGLKPRGWESANVRRFAPVGVRIVCSARHSLKAGEGSVDILRMTGFHFENECLTAECLAVLGCYELRDAAARSENPEHAGWLNRVEEVAGVDPTALTGVHGMLIARGMLKFEITGRNVGLQYQISNLGRDALARQSLAAGDPFAASLHSAESDDMVAAESDDNHRNAA